MDWEPAGGEEALEKKEPPKKKGNALLGFVSGLIRVLLSFVSVLVTGLLFLLMIGLLFLFL